MEGDLSEQMMLSEKNIHVCVHSCEDLLSLYLVPCPAEIGPLFAWQ